MKRHLTIALAVTAGLMTTSGTAQDAKAAIEMASAALGAGSLSTIQYSGWGSDYIFGQAYDGNASWPRFNLPSYSMSIDYAAPAMRDERRRAQAENPPLGGGFQPLAGELRQIWALNGTYAWDVAGAEAVAPAVERDMRPAVAGRLAQIWLTPHGFVKAALAASPAVRTETVRGAPKTIVTFTTPTNVTLAGTLNDRHLVERIETWFDNPVLGDMAYEAVFDGYKDYGGVKFPSRILHRSAGYPILEVNVTDVKPNAPVSIPVPDNIRQAKPAAAGPLQAEAVSPGVWIVPGGARSLAVEFADHVVLVDGPETEARSLAVIDAVARAVPGKRIRYVINTHSHFDHAGGLRTYAAEGAVIVTHRDNIPFYEQAWSNPRTINPDRLAKSGRKAAFEGVVGSRILSDGSRTLAVYHYAGNMHNPGMLMVYLPKERILFEADSFTPPANLNAPPNGFANLVHFNDAVARLRLDVDQIVPAHGRLTTLADMRGVIEVFKR
jgi:glyoxylase-like metal-dependent hydrolase (beta-lactamase superfamily II)